MSSPIDAAPKPLSRIVDIVMLSFAKDEVCHRMTINAIESLFSSEPEGAIKFNVLVIESNRAMSPYQYPRTRTLYPAEAFGYHRFLNLGIRQTAGPYICMCNNDLLFHPHWASNILLAMDEDPALISASPRCSFFHGQHGDIDLRKKVHLGYENGIHVAGWCIFVRRTLFDIIGKLDERFEFWHCDDDYRNTLQKYLLKHALISNAVVDHFGSRTLNNPDLSEQERWRLTTWQRLYYEYKWGHRSEVIYVLKAIKYLLRRMWSQL